MKILFCFGTRPEAIKMAPVYFALQRAKIPVVVCVTSQHKEMLNQVLNFFKIIPKYNLGLMQPDQNLNELSASILKAFNEILANEKPDLVLVHGDTTTSMISALAAFHLNIKIAHIEAGLRTYDKNSPFPEEMYRQITGRLADFYFAPTIKAQQNLISEGVESKKIVVTGNTVVDALLWVLKKLENGYSSDSIEQLKKKIDLKKQIILVTGHRRESFGKGIKNLCDALIELSSDKNIEIVFPVHLNPHVHKMVHKMLSDISNIHLIEPLDYPSIVWLMSKSKLIISDSGGIQEEAPTLKVPVVVTREITERNEGIASGCSFLVGTNSKKIIAKTLELLNIDNPLKDIKNPYGNGDAAIKIADIIKNQILNVGKK